MYPVQNASSSFTLRMPPKPSFSFRYRSESFLVFLSSPIFYSRLCLVLDLGLNLIRPHQLKYSTKSSLLTSSLKDEKSHQSYAYQAESFETVAKLKYSRGKQTQKFAFTNKVKPALIRGILAAIRFRIFNFPFCGIKKNVYKLAI